MAPIIGPIGPIGPPMGGPIGGRIPVIVNNIIDALDYLFTLQDFPDFKPKTPNLSKMTICQHV